MNNPLDSRYIGSVCEIRTFNNELLSIGIINKLSSEYIEIVPKNNDLRLFNTAAKLKLNVFNSKAGLSVLICEVYTSSRDMLKVVEPIQIIDHERRTGFRVEVNLAARISLTEKFDDNAEQGQIFKVSVKDLSMCGLRIFSNTQFSQNQIIWLEIQLEKDKIISKAQIMRESNEIVIRGAKIYEYGVKLFLEDNGADNKICSYIFKRQRELAQSVR